MIGSLRNKIKKLGVSKMKVMFFLEPTIEFSNPLFRYTTLKNMFLPQIKSLIAEGSECCAVLSSPIAEKAQQDGIAKEIGSIAIVDPIEWNACENYLSRSLRHLAEQVSPMESERLSKILKHALPEGFFPDLIIVWESPASFLRDIFPNVPVLYQMPGIFSRPPYPNFISMDQGLLWGATDPRTLKSLPRGSECLDELRKEIRTLTSLENGTYDFVNRLRRRFKSLVLLPLQVDGYFMVDGCLGAGMNQLDMLVDILENVPNDVGIIVTTYRSRDIHTENLSENFVNFLKSRYENFIYDRKIDLIKNPSQLLVGAVDGVVCISSSVGYQAALWKKPLLVYGRSHLTYYKTAENISEFVQQVDHKSTFCRDAELIQSLSFLNFPERDLHGSAYVRRLHQFLKNKEMGRLDPIDISQVIRGGVREREFIAQIGLHDEMRSNSTRLHSKELALQIARHEVISFDIFDTLVNRPFMRPSDLFKFMSGFVQDIIDRPEIDFAIERRKAEEIAFNCAVASGRGEVKLKEIYKVFRKRVGITIRELNKIMDLEIEMEVKLLARRESGYRAFQLAKSLSKRVILVSDMYLPSGVIEKILEKNGYIDYEKLFLSSDIGVKKHNGALFDHVLKDLGVPPSTVLHVGDNVVGDVQRAKSRGIKAFHLVHSLEKFKETSAYTMLWKRDEDRHSLDWQIVLACIGHKFCNNPYLPERKGTLFGGDPWRLGYYGVGPLLLGFARWLLISAMRDGIDRLYFLSRDGYLMKMAYDLIAANCQGAPKSIYLLCSRRAVNLSKVRNVSQLIDLVDIDYAYNMKLADLLYNRFGLSRDDYSEAELREFGFQRESRITQSDRSNLKMLISGMSSKIFTVAKEEREQYISYLNLAGVYTSGNAAVVDIGYAGTMQESLYELNDRQKIISGYYMITFRDALKRVSVKGLEAKGFLAEFVDRHDTFHPFCKHVPLYETMFSSPDTSFIRMVANHNGLPVAIFAPPGAAEQKRRDLVVSIHSGAVDFVEDFVKRFGDLVLNIDFEPNKLVRVLDSYFSAPHGRDARMLEGVEFEDFYGGRNKVIISPDSSKSEMDSVWRSGRDAIINYDRSSEISNNGYQGANQKNLGESNAPRGVRRDKRSHGFDVFFARMFLGKRKFEKFLRDPEIFFSDAKSPIVRFLGRIYCLW